MIPFMTPCALFFVQSGCSLAPRQLGQHVGKCDIFCGQHDQHVKQQIGRLTGEVRGIAALGREYRLGRLLADFFQHRIEPFGIERCDVGASRRGVLALMKQGFKAEQNFGGVLGHQVSMR